MTQKRAAIYARFSSDKQTEASIDAQVRACEAYAEAHGLRIIRVYADEGVSGKGSSTSKRKEYQRMLKDCQAGFYDAILIHQYDRVARNLREHVKIDALMEECGVSLIAVNQDFGGGKEAKLLKPLMWALSEYFIDNLGEEVRKGLKENALHGLHNGGCAPFGYDVENGKYIINPIESLYVKRLFQAAADGSGFQEIISEMQKAGITGKRGANIRYPQIYEILRNEKYTGTYLYSPSIAKTRQARRAKEEAIRIEAAFPAIIDKSLWKEVQKRMDQRKNTGRSSSKYLCSGLVYCANCGAKMHASTSTRKGHSYSRYACSAKCGMPTVRTELVDDAAISYLRELLSGESQRTIAAAMRIYARDEKRQAEDFAKEIEKEAREKQKKIDSLIATLALGTLPAEAVARVGEEIQKLSREIEELRTTPIPRDYTKDQILEWMEAIKKTPDEQAVHLLIEKIEVRKTKNATDIHVKSTLDSVAGKDGRGNSRHCLPAILFEFHYQKNNG